MYPNVNKHHETRASRLELLFPWVPTPKYIVILLTTFGPRCPVLKKTLQLLSVADNKYIQNLEWLLCAKWFEAFEIAQKEQYTYKQRKTWDEWLEPKTTGAIWAERGISDWDKKRGNNRNLIMFCMRSPTIWPDYFSADSWSHLNRGILYLCYCWKMHIILW